MTRRDTWVALFIIAVLVVIGALCIRGERACAAKGGQYVRGLFWMECVR